MKNKVTLYVLIVVIVLFLISSFIDGGILNGLLLSIGLIACYAFFTKFKFNLRLPKDRTLVFTFAASGILFILSDSLVFDYFNFHSPFISPNAAYFFGLIDAIFGILAFTLTVWSLIKLYKIKFWGLWVFGLLIFFIDTPAPFFAFFMSGLPEPRATHPFLCHFLLLIYIIFVSIKLLNLSADEN